MPKKTNLDPSNLLEEDPEFVQFAGIFGRYFYRPNPGYPPFGPLTPQDAFITSAKLVAMFRHYREPNLKPNPEVLMESLQVGFGLSLELESSMSTLREALKQHLHKSFCAAMEEFEIEQYKRNRLATRASALNETRPGRIPDLLIQKRKEIVRELMATPVDFQNSEKVGTLFKGLDAEQIPLPKWRGSLRSWQPKTWKELLEKPRSPEYLRRIAVLKRDLYPPRQG